MKNKFQKSDWVAIVLIVATAVCVISKLLGAWTV